MKKAAVAFALILASIALVACGGGGDDDTTATTSNETTSESGAAAGGEKSGEAEGKSAGSATALDFEADPSGGLAYTTDSATAKAGKVTLDFTNPQPLAHDVAIEDSSGKTIGKTELVTEGSGSEVVDLKPGAYTFYCTVPGHREAGMEGTLTVK
jgi:plastocyanin